MNDDRCRWNGSAQPREEWRPVVGYEGHYEVSSTGLVMSLKYGRRTLMKGGLNGCGYPKVYLWLNGQGKSRTRHSLVITAFVGPYPEGMEVRHVDGDKLNLAVENLAYGTRSENAQDQVRHGTFNGLVRPEVCKYGHAFDEANTRIVHRDGTVRRDCRACHARRSQESRDQRKRAA